MRASGLTARPEQTERAERRLGGANGARSPAVQICFLRLVLPPSGGRRDDMEYLSPTNAPRSNQRFFHFFVVFSILVFSIVLPFQHFFFFKRSDFFIFSLFLSISFFVIIGGKTGAKIQQLLAFFSVTLVKKCEVT